VAFGKECNVYLNQKAPWHLIKKDRKAAGHAFNVCVQAVHAFAVLLNSFIPDTSIRILEFLNLDPSKLEWNDISSNAIKGGHKIKSPVPLFEKLDVNELQEKLEKIKETKIKGEKDLISYDYFKKLDIRVALIKEVEKVSKADKLYKLTIDLGTETRTLVAGLAEHYEVEKLKGKKIVILANLEPRTLKGIESQGMLLAAVDGEIVSVLTPDKDIPPGAKIE
jgi:methionyl-tRNA synthetase